MDMNHYFLDELIKLAAAREGDSVDKLLKGVIIGVGGVGGAVGAGMNLGDLLADRNPTTRQLLMRSAPLLIGAAAGTARAHRLKGTEPRRAKTATVHQAGEHDGLNKGHLSQLGKNLAVIGVGTGLGYGAGWLASKSYKKAGAPGSKYLPTALAAAGGGVAWLMRQRDQESQRLMNKAGSEYATNRKKLAKLLAPKEYWSDSERETIHGAGKGALVGTALAGLGTFLPGGARVAPLIAGGTLVGGALGFNKVRKLKKQQQQQEQGFR